MSDLPADLEEEILSRVPATSLKLLRSTCKRWNALFKDRRFTEKHFRKSPKQSNHVLMLKEFRLCSVIVDLNVVPPSIEFKDALSLEGSHSDSEQQLDIAEVFHCDGLLLCITEEKKLLVCNPCSGETKWIQHESGYKKHSRFALGYENNNSGRNYKILMYRHSCEREGTVCGFEIYEFSSNTWRVVNTPNCIRTIIYYHSVTLKGNTYWISNDDEYLLNFDFTGERFRRLCLPSFMNPCRINMALSVVREEQLSVLHYSYGLKEMEMWVSNKIDSEAELSWSKSFAVNLHGDMGDCLYAFTSLIIDEEKKVALCCNSRNGVSMNKNMVYTIGENDGYYTKIPYIKYSYGWWPFIFNYVPSLVQI